MKGEDVLSTWFAVKAQAGEEIVEGLILGQEYGCLQGGVVECCGQAGDLRT